jgi:hypothetical protein
MAGEITLNRIGLIPSNEKSQLALSKITKKKIIFPLDEALGIDKLPFKMTVSVMLEIAYWAHISSSYDLATIQINRAMGFKINPDTVRFVANTVGKIIFDKDTKEAEDAISLLESGKMEFHKNKNDYVLFLEIDGAMLHTREKSEDGYRWRENKLGVVFSSENFKYRRNKETNDLEPVVGEKEYRAFVGEAEIFKKHCWALALKHNYTDYEEVVLISDGATWIRNMKDEYFPNAQQILDYFHLCQNVSNFAKTVFDDKDEVVKPWTDKICKLLKNSQSDVAKREIEKIDSKLFSKSKFDLLGYLKNNENNIDYQTYIKKGYFIGSGLIESGNKSVLQQRLKQAGMRWNVVTGQYMVTLMAKSKSKLWVEEVVKPVYRFYGIKESELKASTILQNSQNDTVPSEQ